MTLSTYSVDNDGVLELHGDLEINSKGRAWTEFLDYGFCFGLGGSWDRQDCLYVRTAINTNKIRDDPSYATSFETWDMWYGKSYVPKGRWKLETDRSNSEKIPSKSWVVVPEMSTKSCTRKVYDQSNPNMFVICDSVNLHFYRDYRTEAPEHD